MDRDQEQTTRLNYRDAIIPIAGDEKPLKFVYEGNTYVIDSTMSDAVELVHAFDSLEDIPKELWVKQAPITFGMWESDYKICRYRSHDDFDPPDMPVDSLLG